ncbi:MAG: hypothetical protein N2508_12775 [Anaerolineae bacterium]|nr:hypothetical protein [Anaerolineae bacterium]
MAQETWNADEIEVTVRGLFTTHHLFQTARGTLAELVFPFFSLRSILHTADGRQLLARRVSLWRTRHELRDGDTVLATAQPLSFWSRGWAIRFGSQEYLLKPTDFWANRWQLSDEVGSVLLQLSSRGVFRRSAHLTVSGEIDADLLAFAYYLVQVRQEEQAAGASAHVVAPG